MKYPILFFTLLFPSLLKAELYVVQRGDTLLGLAVKYGLSSSLIKKVNELPYDQLKAGQKLFLPKEVVSYTVRNGDTISSIAEDNDISASYLVTLNNLDDDMLAEGQHLKIPKVFTPKKASEKVSKVSSSASYDTHTVSRGETLSGIALRYKVSLASLKDLNDKKDHNIRIGEVLRVEAEQKRESVKVRESLPAQPKMATNVKIYVVRPNDTLSGVALRHKISQRDILAWNNKKKSTLYRGESLRILSFSRVGEPAKKNEEPAAKASVYTVRKGDNLRLISDKFGVSVRDLKEWNDKTSDLIHVNEKLKVFAEAPKTAAKTRTVVYIVRRGDTVDGIAAKLKTTRSALMAANNKKNTKIFVGEKLKASVAETPTVVASASRSAVSRMASASPQGLKSSRFTEIPLPVAYSELKTAVPSGRGVDIYLKSQASLKSPTDALVEYAGYINALQNVVILKVEEDRTLIYAGLRDLSVKSGQQISKGDILGNAGYSTLDESAKIYLELRDKAQVANAFYAYKDLEKYVKK